MKNQSFELKLPIEYTEKDIISALKKKGANNITATNILRKSLDARKKNNIIWNLNVEINTPKSDFISIAEKSLNIFYKKREKHIIVVGSGPSGIFSGLVLLRAGFKVTVLEKGSKVETRDKDIEELLNKGLFKHDSNFAFGEGGAGTYSDGKLTSRNKHISKEKDFILSTYINNGAPKEIYSMVHPHVGSDNLKIVTKNLRESFINLGGKILFNTSFLSFTNLGDKIKQAVTTSGNIDCDYLMLATGHSSFSTYRELAKKGVQFNTKNFAIGFRAEHPQHLINSAQWGVESIKGLKAAEYRLTAKTNSASVFSFCMCPGGVIVPSASTPQTSVVNGMSNYQRNGEFANAAIVATFNFEKELNRTVDPLESLDLLNSLEKQYFDATGGYSLPSMKISDFLDGKTSGTINNTSYLLGTTPYNLNDLLPKTIVQPLKEGLLSFSKKIKGFETGNIMGLESKTSSPIQVIRDKNGLCSGFSNLYFTGEGSGWAGGIISSGADGIKGAMDIIKKES